MYWGSKNGDIPRGPEQGTTSTIDIQIPGATILTFTPTQHRGSAVAGATLAQAVGAWGMFVYTAGATAIAGDLSVSATYIGYQIGIAYFAATVCTLFSATITRRWGAVSTLALAMAFVALGASVTTLWQLTGMFAGSIIMGIGFGLIPAAASQVLITVTDSSNRAFIFSIKQSGIPIGGVLSALTTPLFSELWGWRAAGYAVSLTCFVVFIYLFVNRNHWNIDDRSGASTPLNPLLPLIAVGRSPSLVRLTYMAACFVCVQIVWLAFLSPFFVEDLKISLVQAGYFLAIIQVTGIFGRIIWGWISDRLQDNFSPMLFLGGVMALCSAAAYALSADTPFVVLALLCFFIGFSAVSWNGVFHAAMIEVSPPGETVQAIAGMAFYVYIAMFVWPALFAFLIETTGSYVLPLLSLVVFSIGGVLFGWRAKALR